MAVPAAPAAGACISPTCRATGTPEAVATRSWSSADQIAGVLHLVDARHPGLDADRDAHDWLASLGVERVVVATKIDKLSRVERARNLEELKRGFGTAALPISAARGEGLDDLWNLITRMARPMLRPR